MVRNGNVFLAIFCHESKGLFTSTECDCKHESEWKMDVTLAAKMGLLHMKTQSKTNTMRIIRLCNGTRSRIQKHHHLLVGSE